MRTRVCHITTVHGPFDSRIFQKECRSLVEQGYEVFEVAPWESDLEVDGVKVLSIRRFENRLTRMLLAPWLALRRALSTRAKIYHFHDPELIPAGVILKIMGKTVIYDAHENLPAQITSKPWMRGGRWATLLSRVIDVFEKAAVLAFDAVISVIPEILERFPEKKGVLVRNLPVLRVVRSVPAADVEKERVVCCYAGALTRIRGIKELIQAVSLTGNEVSLWLVGNWESDRFHQECEALDGYEHVTYCGVVPPDAVYSYLKMSDIGLATLHPVANYTKSLPVKSFEYLACGLPVIISDFPYFRQIYGDSVWYVDPYHPKEIASCIDWILAHPKESAAKAATGRAIVEHEYNWEAESKRLLDLYKRLSPSQVEET